MRISKTKCAAAGAAVIGAVALAAPAMASKSTTSWIAFDTGAGTSAASTQPALGDLVMFDSGYPSNVKNARIEVLCYQNGQLVYGEAGAADQTVQQSLTGYPGFLLGGGGSAWRTNGGAASCTANLFYFGSKAGAQTYNKLASMTFDAAG